MCPKAVFFFLICSLQPYYNSDYVSGCAAQRVLSSSQHAGIMKHHRSVSQRWRHEMLPLSGGSSGGGGDGSDAFWGSKVSVKTQQSPKTRLTRSREWRSSTERAGFSSLSVTAPQTVWAKVRGHCHCVPSSANSSLVSRQSHNRQHSWERGRIGTCSTPCLFRGLFRDCFMLFSSLLHV